MLRGLAPSCRAAWRAGGAHQAHDVLLHGGVHVDLTYDRLQLQQLVRTDNRLQLRERVLQAEALQDGALFVLLRVADGDAQQETVHLGFGQREGAGELDRILGGEDEERPRQRAGDAVDRHLAFLHGLEQGGLGARAGAVDLVGQDDLGGDRAGTELKIAAFLVEDADAHDVGGQQVGRELDALEGTVERARQRTGQNGLADARDVLQQRVPLAEQGDEEQVDDVFLADKDSADIGAQGLGGVLHFGDFAQDLWIHSVLVNPTLRRRHRR